MDCTPYNLGGLRSMWRGPLVLLGRDCFGSRERGRGAGLDRAAKQGNSDWTRAPLGVYSAVACDRLILCSNGCPDLRSASRPIRFGVRCPRGFGRAPPSCKVAVNLLWCGCRRQAFSRPGAASPGEVARPASHALPTPSWESTQRKIIIDPKSLARVP